MNETRLGLCCREKSKKGYGKQNKFLLHLLQSPRVKWPVVCARINFMRVARLSATLTRPHCRLGRACTHKDTLYTSTWLEVQILPRAVILDFKLFSLRSLALLTQFTKSKLILCFVYFVS